MSGTFIAKNIAIGKIHLGEWRILTQSNSLVFDYNDHKQLEIEPRDEETQNQNKLGGTLILGDPIEVNKSQRNSEEIILDIKFDASLFKYKSEAYGFNIAYANTQVECEVFSGDYIFGSTSSINKENIILTKSSLLKPIFFRFKYDVIPDSIACLLYVASTSNQTGGGLVESIPFGIRFINPTLVNRVMYKTPQTSVAGGVINKEDTLLHGLVIVDQTNKLSSGTTQYKYQNYSQSTKKRVQQKPDENVEFLAQLVDKNGVLDLKKITIRFYQFSDSEIQEIYTKNAEFAHDRYGSRIYKTLLYNNTYSKMDQIPNVSKHENFIKNNVTMFNDTYYSFNNILIYKLTKEGYDSQIYDPNERPLNQNHATNLYVKFRLVLDKELFNNDINYIIPFIYINDDTTPVKCIQSPLRFDNLTHYKSNLGYGIGFVSSGKPTLMTYASSYDYQPLNSDVINKNILSSHQVQYRKYGDSWSWNPDEVNLEYSLNSKYLVMQNLSSMNSIYVNISFNGTQFNGAISNEYILIKNNVRFTLYLIDNADTTRTTNKILNDTEFIMKDNMPVDHTHVKINNDSLRYDQYLMSKDTEGSYVLHLPKLTIGILQYTIINMPDYLPADIYTQTFTVTDMTEYIKKSTESPIFRFEHGNSKYEFHSEYNELYDMPSDYLVPANTDYPTKIINVTTFETNRISIKQNNYVYIIDKSKFIGDDNKNITINFSSTDTDTTDAHIYKMTFDKIVHTINVVSKTVTIGTASGDAQNFYELDDEYQLQFQSYTYVIEKITKKVNVSTKVRSSIHYRNHPIYVYSVASDVYLFISEYDAVFKLKSRDDTWAEFELVALNGPVKRINDTTKRSFEFTVKEPILGSTNYIKHKIPFVIDRKVSSIKSFSEEFTIGNTTPTTSSSSKMRIYHDIDLYFQLKFSVSGREIVYDTIGKIYKLTIDGQTTGDFNYINSRYITIKQANDVVAIINRQTLKDELNPSNINKFYIKKTLLSGILPQ